MEDGLLAEVERDIRDYEAFLKQRKEKTTAHGNSECSAADQLNRASSNVGVPTNQERSVVTTTLQSDADLDPKKETESTIGDSSTVQGERTDMVAERPASATLEKSSPEALQSSDDEELCQIFDDLVSLRCPELKLSSPSEAVNQASPCSEDLSPRKIPPPQQEWFDFKRGQYKSSNQSGPEEIVSSTYSHVGGSSYSEVQPGGTSTAAMAAQATIQNRHSKEAIQRSVETEMKKELTFRPKLISRQRQASRSIPHERRERLKQLSRPKTPKILAEHEAEKEVREAADLAECSFRPRTGRPPENRADKQPVEQRLYHAHDTKNSAMARCMMEREKEVLMECTFHPVVNRQRPKLKSYIPLPERAMEIQIAKRERLLSQRDQEATFTPSINARSKQLVKRKEENQLSQHVDSDGLCMIQSPNASPSKGTQERDRDCTYAPEINPLSKKLCERLNIPDNFVARQDFFDALKRKKQEAMKASLEEAECTFAPKIVHRDDVLAASRFAGRLFEDQEEFVERLAHKDRESREAKKAVREDAQTTAYTFKPEINTVSKLIGKSRTIEDLYKEGKEKIRRVDDRSDDDPECTFRPSLRKPAPSYLRTRRSSSQTEEGLWEKTQIKAQRDALFREQRREQADRSELKGCTFTPTIKYSVPRTKDPIAIAGLGRYLELRQSAQRMKDEQKRREDQIFRSKKEETACTMSK